MNAKLTNKEIQAEQMEMSKFLKLLLNLTKEEKERLYWMLKGVVLVRDAEKK